MSALEVLAQVRQFRALPRSALVDLVHLAQRRSVPPGAHLVWQGDTSDALFVLVEGHVRLECEHPALRGPVEVAEFGPGELIAERGILGGQPRTATAIALTRVEILEIGAARMEQKLAAVQGTAPLLRMLRTVPRSRLALPRRFLLE